MKKLSLFFLVSVLCASAPSWADKYSDQDIDLIENREIREKFRALMCTVDLYISEKKYDEGISFLNENYIGRKEIPYNNKNDFIKVNSMTADCYRKVADILRAEFYDAQNYGVLPTVISAYNKSLSFYRTALYRDYPYDRSLIKRIEDMKWYRKLARKLCDKEIDPARAEGRERRRYNRQKLDKMFPEPVDTSKIFKPTTEWLAYKKKLRKCKALLSVKE